MNELKHKTVMLSVHTTLSNKELGRQAAIAVDRIGGVVVTQKPKVTADQSPLPPPPVPKVVRVR